MRFENMAVPLPVMKEECRTSGSEMVVSNQSRAKVPLKTEVLVPRRDSAGMPAVETEKCDLSLLDLENN